MEKNHFISQDANILYSDSAPCFYDNQ